MSAPLSSIFIPFVTSTGIPTGPWGPSFNRLQQHDLALYGSRSHATQTPCRSDQHRTEELSSERFSYFNMLKFVWFVDGVVDIQHCAAGITKHRCNTLFGQALHVDVGAIEFHIYSFRNQHWYSDRPLGPEL